MRFSPSHATMSHVILNGHFFRREREKKNEMFSFVFWNVRKLTELIPLDPAIISIELLELTRIFTNEIKWCVHEICDVVWDDCISINAFRSIELYGSYCFFHTSHAMQWDEMGKKRTEQFVMRLLIWNALLRTIEMSFFAMMGVLRATLWATKQHM